MKKVSPEDQKIIQGVAKRHQKKARAIIRKANADALKTIVRKGIVLVDVPKPMVDELTAIAVEVQSELVGKVYSKEELDKVLAYRAEFRAKQAKAATESVDA